MSLQDISKNVENHVTTLFRDSSSDKLLYHNFEHTHNVVQRAMEIASFYKLDEESLFVVKVAAWFHDTGYLFSGQKNHEQESVKIMGAFFVSQDLSLNIIAKVIRTIMATKEHAIPVSLGEKILSDADTYHFGTDEFKKTDGLIRKEIELTTGSIPAAWVQHTITMLKNHRFHTSYCIDRLEPGKMRNIAWLESLLPGISRH